MWYYERNHQAEGPVSSETLQELLRNGAINVLTLVWQEGMPDWKHLGETELGQYAKSTNPVPSLSSFPGMQPAAPQPGSMPVVRTQAQRLKSTILKGLFTWWAVFAVIYLAYQVLASVAPNSGAIIAISCFADIAIVFYVVLQFVLLYDFWKVIQDGFASTTPGKAVGFLFIPLFNLYWFFRAYLNLSRDMNKYIDRHFALTQTSQVRKTHPILSLVYLLASFIGGGTLYWMMISSIMASGTSSTDILTTYNALLTHFNVPIVLFAVITTVLFFGMMFDFYLSAKAILEKEEPQS